MHWDIEGLACVLGHRGFGVCIGRYICDSLASPMAMQMTIKINYS